MSLTSGIFADALKIAGVTPVLKFENLGKVAVTGQYQLFLDFLKKLSESYITVYTYI